MTPQLRLDESNLLEYLRKIAVIPEGGSARIEAVGDGNINWVRSVRGHFGGVVVKQARPALERFPEYQVSTERIVFEARFYARVAELDVDRVCPRVLCFDEVEHVLVLEDLGNARRLDDALSEAAPVSGAAATVARFLGRVHVATRRQNLEGEFDNQEMRRLHGDHIFHLPYRENDFPLSAAVAAKAGEIRQDAELVERIDTAYSRYLAPGHSLVHGDVQSTNVLLCASGPKLLDAEIAHLGDPAFDVGQLCAHLLLPWAARGNAGSAGDSLRAAWDAYREASADESRTNADRRLRGVACYAGIELLRRTIGAARVPWVEDDEAALRVLDCGVSLVRGTPLPGLEAA